MPILFIYVLHNTEQEKHISFDIFQSTGNVKNKKKKCDWNLLSKNNTDCSTVLTNFLCKLVNITYSSLNEQS